MYLFLSIHIYIYTYVYIYIYIHNHNNLSGIYGVVTGLTWLPSSATESLAEYGWEPHRDLLAQQMYRRPPFTGICVKHRGVWFHRIRDFKHYYFNSIPPTSHCRGVYARRAAHCACCFLQLLAPGQNALQTALMPQNGLSAVHLRVCTSAAALGGVVVKVSACGTLSSRVRQRLSSLWFGEKYHQPLC